MLLFLFFTSPLHKWLGQSLALGCSGKYVHVGKALAPLASAFVSLEFVSTLQAFHPLILRFFCINS